MTAEPLPDAEVMRLLDAGSNPLSSRLSPQVRARLWAVVENPTEATWEDAHCIAVRGMSTLWNAVTRHSDYAVNSRPLDGPWPQIPTRAQILAGLRGELAP